MLRLGARPDKASEMDLDHIFISRLKLLIVMARTYLRRYPLGSVRKSALVKNADYITAESIDLEQLIPIRSERPAKGGMNFDHVFFQRVKLLASLANAIGNDGPMGEHREAALRDNLRIIGDSIKFNSGVKKVAFLKVA